jgi:CDP-paratose 2-epimerase
VSVAVITGSTGLVGSEAASYFGELGMDVVGVDNDMRKVFFGSEASTNWNRERLEGSLGGRYAHHSVDIRDRQKVDEIFGRHGKAIELVIHAAAQPSHDWAAKEPVTDFDINAVGTLNVLEATRAHAPDAVFIFTSTNKVYGDRPNTLPLVETATRFEVDGPDFWNGIPETFSVDQSKHSLFGASKVAADVLVQEYGRYFDMKTCCLRGGCLTGPNHSGVELHGFLSYLVKCGVEGRTYRIYGYKGKQVRDNIHSYDVARFIEQFWHQPRCAEVYNIGGGRQNSCSLLEAFDCVAAVTGREVQHVYVDQNRSGDHIWYISDVRKMRAHYPEWDITRSLDTIVEEIARAYQRRPVTA